MTTSDAHEVVWLEQRLLDPTVRADPAAAGDLVHPDFIEFGKSGRVWDRQSILAMMADDPSVTGVARDFVPVQLSDDVVHLTYRSGDGARRSSIWVRDPRGR